MTDLDEALASFDGNDVPLRAALAHLVADLPRARLLETRLAPTPGAIDEARTLARGLGSALLMEAFVAAPLETSGDAGAALEARLLALPLCPRWESWVASALLTRLSASLLSVGRAAEAIRVAERALRFMPADPDVLASLAAADPSRKAAIGAHLRDHGYFAPFVVGPPSDDERRAEAWTPRLDDLEPMSDSDLARYLVYDRFDVANTETTTEARRHAATSMRRGNFGGARVALTITEKWAGEGSPARAWLGISGLWRNGFFASRALRAVLEASSAWARLASSGKKHGARFASARATRERAAVDLAARGETAEAELLLEDWLLAVRATARAHLPGSSLVAKLEAEEAAVADLFAMRALLVRNPDGTEYAATHPSHVTLVRDGVPILYPTPAATAESHAAFYERFPSYVERAPNARSKCKVCKQTIDEGAFRLVVSGGNEPGDNLAHVACGLDRRFRDGLADVLTRDRRPLPERERLEAELLAPKKGRPKKAPPAR